MSDWISVEERLPEENGTYLVKMRIGDYIEQTMLWNFHDGRFQRSGYAVVRKWKEHIKEEDKQDRINRLFLEFITKTLDADICRGWYQKELTEIRDELDLMLLPPKEVSAEDTSDEPTDSASRSEDELDKR